MKRLKTIFACMLMALFSIGQVWADNAAKDAVLFSENFDGYSADAVPSGSVSSETNHRVIFGNGSVTYASANGSGSSAGATKVMNAQQGAEGTLPELMVGKKGSGSGAAGGTFSISGIPSGGAKEITVSYKQNAKTLAATITGTGYSTTFTSANVKATTTFDITVADGADATFTLTLQATTTNNVRVDDICIIVKTAGTGGPTDPTVSADDVELESEAYNDESIALTYSDLGDNNVTNVTATLYDDEECNTEFSGGWITDLKYDNTNWSYITFDASEYTGTTADRVAYMKIVATIGSTTATKVISITQAKVVVDYATLPFTFNSGRDAIANTNGITQNGLDTDYGDANCKLKFKTAGTWVIIKINGEPGELTYSIKNNSFSGGIFDVLESEDGDTYTPVVSHTEITNTQNEKHNLNKDSRFVKFIYTSKSNGNVGLGNIGITAYEAPTVCEAPTFTPESGETFTETLDVVLTSATPGATIYYTLDESEPNTSSSVFDTKITLTESKTIKAIAVKDGLSNSSVASATFTKVLVIDSYEIDFETNDLAPYVNWEFSNIACATTTIDAHGGDYYGNTDGKTTASITTKTKYTNPGTLTFWTSKETNNSTASSWVVAVSTDGSDWSTTVETFSATTGNKGDWTKREADLSEYSNVYVRIAYDGTSAVRAIDDISLEPAAAVKKPVISNGESFLTSAEVSITCGTTGATIYYTTDGSDPKSGSEYSSSFTLTETATVRAIAKLDEDWSAEAESKTFTKITVVNVATALSASENDNVYVQGTITSITEVNTGFKNATYVISDMSAGLPQNEMIVYRGKYVDGADFTSADQIHIGDVVVVSGTIGIHDAKNQLVQGNQIETISAPAVAAPAFTPDGGGFMGEASVTITSATEGAIVYYTLDGTTPSNASLTAQPIVLTATTTIKAIAIKDEENSMVVSKTFTLSEPMTVAAALDALDSEDPINNVAVAGIISTAPTSDPNSGKLTYYISDDGTDTDELEVFLGFGLNGASFSAKTDLQVGDEVTVFGNLTIFNSTTKEFASGSRLLAFNRPVFAVTGVEVDETATVKVNKTVQLTANVLPVNATNKNVSWSVKAGSEAYAEVSASGLVTGKAQGTAIIVVTTEDGGFTEECTVTVNPGPPANTDILTAEEIGVGSSYDDWSGNGFGTSSEYAGNSMTATGDYAGAIQLRSKDNSGIVLTASNGLYLKNLSVTVKSGTNTLNVYAKNSAYTSTADLYNEETRGTLIGTVSATGNMTLVDDESISYNNNYQFIGMRSANGALYLDDITITWGDAYVAPTKYSVTYAAGEGSGDAPDAVEYEENETFEVAAGNLFTAPEGKEFDKWNDGTNDYEPGDTYTVGTADVVLTAQWKDVTPEPSYGSYNRDQLIIGDYGTICLPKAGTISGAVLFAIGAYEGGMIMIDEIGSNEMVAGRPYIFQAIDNELTVEYSSNETTDAGSHNGLYGSYDKTLLAADNGNYILYNNLFYFVNSDNVYVGANRAYIKIGMINYTEPAPGRRRVAMSINGNQMPTEVENVEINNAPRKVVINGEMYIIRGEKRYDVRGQLVK